jgi:hypothetical protein
MSGIAGAYGYSRMQAIEDITKTGNYTMSTEMNEHLVFGSEMNELRLNFY